MSNSYSDGARIALDINKDDELKAKHISEIICRIKNSCGEDTPLSTHSIWAESEQWSTVVASDPFFKDVKVINSTEEFIMKIKRDRVLKGTDIAKFILSKMSCSHLKLEKLCYLCYADYLCKTKGQHLFNDRIYAFKYGPVIDSVYEKFKKYGNLEINKVEKIIKRQEEMKMPSESRILFAKNGIKKIKSIEETLNKYGKLSAYNLVEITHRNGTPWRKTYKGDMYSEISDEEILKNHCKE